MRPEVLARRARSATAWARPSAASSGALAGCGFNSSSIGASTFIVAQSLNLVWLDVHTASAGNLLEMPVDYAVHAEGLVKRYGRVRALDGLDLDVAEGSLLAMAGPNGAGKDTARRVFTTLLHR